MRIVSYTRTTSCYPGADIPANIITEQNDRIKDYADRHGWKIAEKYSDRKKDRNENSSFEELLQDGIQRKFDAVIVDSVFRAGKDLWSAREVLLQTFHFAGIGFIVVEDDYISIGKSNDDAEAYFDSKYSQLRKENIRYRVNQRNRNGILSWNDEKYGYKLTKDYQLVIDEETAPVVRRIFELCAGGMTPRQIADLFTEEKIPIPLVSRGMNVQIDDPYKWDRLKIRRLLDKTVYIGHWTKVVQGEVMEFTNEPIVDEAVFNKVQEYLASIATNAKPPVKKHRFAGIVCDKELGFCIKLRETKTGLPYFAFNKRPEGYKGNTQLFVSDLEEELRNALAKEKIKAGLIEARILHEGEEVKKNMIEQMEAAFCEKSYELAFSQQDRMNTYKRYGCGEVSEHVMKKKEKQYQDSVTTMESYFKGFFEKKERIGKALDVTNPWVVLFKTYDSAMPLDKDTLHRYVSRITLNHMQIDSIEFAHAEWYEELPDDWRE